MTDGDSVGWFNDVWFRLIRDAVALRITHNITAADIAHQLGITVDDIEWFERFYPEPPTVTDCRSYLEAVTDVVARRNWQRDVESTRTE